MGKNYTNDNQALDSGSSFTEFSALEKYLSERLKPAKLSLSITNNRFTMISVKRETGFYFVRLHFLFLKAPFAIYEYLYNYISKNEKIATVMLQKFIDDYFFQDNSSVPLSVRQSFKTHGEIFRLNEIFDELNTKYFNNQIKAFITWAERVATKKRRRSIRMGSYSMEEKIIRIHPSLDRSFVPHYFIAWVIYHEMLHQKHGVHIIGGKRRFHSKQFMAEERLFEEYERAKQWEKANLHRLLLY